MSVCLHYEDKWRGGYRWALIGPDKDGRIKLPPSESNLFVRSGTSGSAPLYHQTRRAKYSYSGSERYTTFYDYLKVNPWGYWFKMAYVARDTWKKVVRIASDKVECKYYYSEGSTLYTDRLVSVLSEDVRAVADMIKTEDNLESQVNSVFSYASDWSRTTKTGWEISVGTENVEVSVLHDGDTSRKYYDFWEGATELGVVIPPPDLRIALSEASEDLASNLPQTPLNLAELLLDLVSVGNISSTFHVTTNVAKMLADSWLKWRYVYTTAKLDVRSMQSFLERGYNLFSHAHGSDFKCQGTSHYSDIACCCTTHIPLTDLKEQFRRASQSLHAYDLWDVVPWSFVVDWFIPIGSMLQDLKYENDLLKVSHGTIWYTCEWYEDSYSENFMRFCTDQFVTTPCSIFVHGDTSNKTIAMRCIDAMALLIGR